VSFLSPISALIAAAVAVPILLLLYVLKLRRRRLRLASTLLWQRTFEDLQVNVPFQRLRFSILLLLQGLVLLLLLLALAEPVMKSDIEPASRVILLIDRSASMNATDVEPADDGTSRTRLDEAKATAQRLVDRLTSTSEPVRVMIITFGTQARSALGFETRADVLMETIEAIEPTDEQADLDAALQLAGVFAARDEASAEQSPDVVLISDGAIPAPDDPMGFRLRTGRFRFVQVGPDPNEDVDNVGIVALSARRDYNDPAQVIVFVRLISTRPAPTDASITLSLDDRPGPVRAVTIDPATGSAPGEATATFTLNLPGGAVIRVRHNVRDVLPTDDTAAVVLPASARPRFALVHGASGPDPFLYELLSEFEPQTLRVLSLEAYEQLDPQQLDLGRLFDLVVFDRVSPERLPGIPTASFGAVPSGIETTEPDRPGGHRILSWDRRHPLMRHVSLENLTYADFGALVLPTGSTALATGPDGPVIALIPARGAQHVVVGFPLRQSNWPIDVSIAVFMQNMVDYLTLARTGQSSIVYRPGEPIPVRVSPNVDRIEIEGPIEMTVEAEPGGAMTLPALRRVGLYSILGVEPPAQVVAVSMLSDAETNIRPRSELTVNARTERATSPASAAPRGIWPWFIALALAIVVVEWLVYCRLLRM
jgi:hypothetical protein